MLYYHVGINLVPVSSWTMEKSGSNHVAIAGTGDKKQITAVICGNVMGECLPLQLIYAGKTRRCHTKFDFPKDWCITNSPKHWSNEDTMLQYIEEVIVPFVDKTKERLGFDSNQPSLAIFDHFKGQMTEKVYKTLEDHSIHSVLVPACCTAKLQPMDVSVNRAVKAFLEREFQAWYASEVTASLRTSDEINPINLTTQEMKHLGAQWLVKMYEHLLDNPHLIVNGFVATGISGCITNAYSACQQPKVKVEVEDDDEYNYSSSDEAVFSNQD